jgi:hypothetical protein
MKWRKGVIKSTEKGGKGEPRRGRKEGRMYYCGGSNLEQAGTVPTFNAFELYATVVYRPLAVKINLPRKRGNRPLTKKANKTVDCAHYTVLLKAEGKYRGVSWKTQRTR